MGLFEDYMLITRSLIAFVFALLAQICLLLLFQEQTCPTHTKNFYELSYSPSKFTGSLSFKDRESLIGKKLTSTFSGFSKCICYIFVFLILLLYFMDI